MNVSSEIYSTNGTKVETDFDTVVNIISILISFPPNSYVIWLIVRGTGNGLAAEFFIFNLSICEILLCVTYVLMTFLDQLNSAGIIVNLLDGLSITGRPLFECLISLERYLAVVHPVTFLRYKPLRFRLMCSAVVWVVTFVSGGFSALTYKCLNEVYFIVLVVSYLFFLSIQSFCCLAVLRALKQSGPGERGREREEENHMKRRAFYLILITTVSMAITYVPYILLLFFFTKEYFEILTYFGQICFVSAGLVQPVLFLCRLGKLNFIKCP